MIELFWFYEKKTTTTTKNRFNRLYNYVESFIHLCWLGNCFLSFLFWLNVHIYRTYTHTHTPETIKILDDENLKNSHFSRFFPRFPFCIFTFITVYIIKGLTGYSFYVLIDWWIIIAITVFMFFIYKLIWSSIKLPIQQKKTNNRKSSSQSLNFILLFPHFYSFLFCFVWQLLFLCSQVPGTHLESHTQTHTKKTYGHEFMFLWQFFFAW